LRSSLRAVKRHKGNAANTERANLTVIASQVSQWMAAIDFKRGFLTLLLHDRMRLEHLHALPLNNAGDGRILHLGNLIRDVGL